MFCHQCGFITNSAFDPALLSYTEEYDNTLHCSSFFQGYINDLAKSLIERYDLHGKELIEIGCGSGDFLRILCELGNNRGVGFDPGLSNEHAFHERMGQVTFIKDFFSEQYVHYRPDFICSRLVLEHIPDPMQFLGMLRRAIGERLNTVFFCEVPNVFYILRDLSVWDIV
jgi:2-polyprenyl-3-methyl-5-hydroxy-6-metoxy-1,4-benzoquinol methylase